MRIRVHEVDFALIDCRTRLPFRFGSSTLTGAPLCTARVLVETPDGMRIAGFSSDLLVPKWFDKNPAASARDDVEGLIASARTAGAQLAARRAPAVVFDHWWALEQDLVAPATTAEGHATPALVRGFGVALVERAMIDAVCRAAGRTFFDALRDGLLGFDPGRVAPELGAWNARANLADVPAASVRVRHTVGLLDALTPGDVTEPVSDGLPECLEADLRRYGVRDLKIKLGGDAAQDLVRLEAIAGVLDHAGVEPQITIDGNEQFDDLATLVTLFDALAARPGAARLLATLVSIEQPLARGRTFEPDANAAMDRLTVYAPAIIDEADADVDSFPRAIAMGYRGVSVKNCKGVFRALLSRARCDLDGGGLFQSAEDLTNLPVVALQQDLATVAALGLTHVERNGHHYFRGLDHLPTDEADAALAAHPDLYERTAGGVELRIDAGRLDLRSLQCPGYGYDVPIRWDERVPADAWSWPEAKGASS